jgi:hypothetical protein
MFGETELESVAEVERAVSGREAKPIHHYCVMYDYQPKTFTCLWTYIVEVGAQNVPIIREDSYGFQFFDSELSLHELNFDSEKQLLEEQIGIKNISPVTYVGRYVTDPMCKEFVSFCDNLPGDDITFKEGQYIITGLGDQYILVDVNQSKIKPVNVISEQEAEKYRKSPQEMKNHPIECWYAFPKKEPYDYWWEE